MSKNNKKDRISPLKISPYPVLILISVIISIFLFLFSDTGIMKNLELRTLDYRFVARGAKIETSHEIIIIAMDNKSFENIREPFFQWPHFIGEVSEMLVKSGVKVIGLDVIQEVSLEKFYPGQTRRMQKILLSDKVVLISAINMYNEIIYPIPQLTAVKGKEIFGPANLTPDTDNIIRKQAIHFNNPESGEPGRNQLPAFPVKVLSRYLDGELTDKDGQYQIGNRFIGNEKGFININFAGPPGTFKMYSFSDVLKKAQDNDEKYFEENFQGKIVLIGRTDTTGKDLFDVPFNVTTGKLMSGIEIHANTINTVLSGKYLRHAPPLATFLIILAFSLITSFLSYFKKPVVSMAICLGLLLLYVLISFLLFSGSGYILNLTMPIIVVPVTLGSSFIYRYHTVDKRMRQIRETFGKLVSHEVEEELWKENLEPVPGKGIKRKVTILFSDINDFTPRCENRSAQEIMEMLNEYFTRMVDIVFDNRGTVKQFVGDEIMVIFGAPHDQLHQAILAVRTAVDMIQALKKDEQSGKPGFYEVKIGIHTGEVTAGFLGSIHRMQYTTIGENVNLAARIESFARTLDTPILISEDTYKELMTEKEELKVWLDDVEIVSVGSHNLKGFKNVFTLYEVRLKEE